MGKYIKGQNRNQLVLFEECLEGRIDAENETRVIDMYVESIDLVEMGFKRSRPNKKGTNGYDPKDMLRLYIYGYKNGIRSSRKLAKLCKTNIEVIWLMRGIEPDFRTISDFRKDNIKELKKVYKDMIIMCTEIDLIGKEYSQDGVKIEAVNSKERNYTLNKVDDRIKRIEEKIEKYIKEMNEIDEQEDKREVKTVSKEELEKRIKTKKRKKEELEKKREQMEKSGESQISLTDPESKLMKNNGKFLVCYNNQVLVDVGSHIVINYEVNNEPADTGSMARLVEEAKETIGKDEVVKNITDKGYYDREDMGKCLEEGIIPEVTLPEGTKEYEIEIENEENEIGEEERKSEKKEDIKKVLRSGEIPEVYKDYIREIKVEEKTIYETKEEVEEGIEEMREEEKRDYAMKNKCFMRDIKKSKVYCPEGEILRKKSTTKGREKYCNKEACKRCKNPCTQAKFKEAMFGEGQIISTSNKELKKDFPQARRKKKRVKKKIVRIYLKPKEEDIKKRMGSSEHPHGTMKRSDNASYFLLKGKEKVNGEMAIYYTAYNIRRIINIKGAKEIMEYLKKRIEKREAKGY